MSSFIVEGGHALHGEIAIKGAKNEALEVICATLLTSEKVIISNLPQISDVRNLIALLSEMGVKVNYITPSEVEFQADEVDLTYIQGDQFRKKVTRSAGDAWTLILSGCRISGRLSVTVPRLTHIISPLLPTASKDAICCLTRHR